MFLDTLNMFSQKSLIYFLFENAESPLFFANKPVILCASWYPISSEVYNSAVIICNSSSLQFNSAYKSEKETPQALYFAFFNSTLLRCLESNSSNLCLFLFKFIFSVFRFSKLFANVPTLGEEADFKA